MNVKDAMMRGENRLFSDCTVTASSALIVGSYWCQAPFTPAWSKRYICYRLGVSDGTNYRRIVQSDLMEFELSEILILQTSRSIPNQTRNYKSEIRIMYGTIEAGH